MAKAKVKLEEFTGLAFQELIFRLQKFWADRDCIIQQPYDVEVGAGTMHPETFFRVLGPAPYRVAYVQPSRRPTDGRYGENPNRLYKHHQMQVILKPTPADVQDLYLQSIESLGIKLSEHDIRFEEDNWEAPTLGAWGIGWQVLLDGLEITQFTYFQQSGGLNLDPISVELTYGLDRIAAYLQNVDNVFNVRWSASRQYGEVRLADERQLSSYSFDYADPVITRKLFDLYEAEATQLLDRYDAVRPRPKKESQGGKSQDQQDGPAQPAQVSPDLPRFPLLAAYEACLKCSHLFNVLDARGVISVTERATLIARIRQMACRVAADYVDQAAASAPATPAGVTE